MLSGTESWKIDRHSLPVSALCKGSWNCNELQSGLFGMLLIFDANIWGEQTFWTTEKWQPKYLPFPVWSYPLDGSLQLSQILFCSLKLSLYLSLSLCLSWPFSVFSLFSFSFCLSPPHTHTHHCLVFRLSAAQSPTVTDPLQQAYAGVQHYAGDLSLLSPLLSHFLHLSLSLSLSPLLFCLSHQ